MGTNFCCAGVFRPIYSKSLRLHLSVYVATRAGVTQKAPQGFFHLHLPSVVLALICITTRKGSAVPFHRRYLNRPVLFTHEIIVFNRCSLIVTKDSHVWE